MHRVVLGLGFRVLVLGCNFKSNLQPEAQFSVAQYRFLGENWAQAFWDLGSWAAKGLEQPIWGLPEIRGAISEVPIIRTIVFWGLYWGPLVLGNYHIHPGLWWWACAGMLSRLISYLQFSLFTTRIS